MKGGDIEMASRMGDVDYNHKETEYIQRLKDQLLKEIEESKELRRDAAPAVHIEHGTMTEHDFINYLDTHYGIYESGFAKSLFWYLATGRETGGFLRACLENNLLEASCRAANEKVLLQLPGIMKFLYNEVLFDAWGTPDKVQVWVDQKTKGPILDALREANE